MFRSCSRVGRSGNGPPDRPTCSQTLNALVEANKEAPSRQRNSTLGNLHEHVSLSIKNHCGAVHIEQNTRRNLLFCIFWYVLVIEITVLVLSLWHVSRKERQHSG